MNPNLLVLFCLATSTPSAEPTAARLFVQDHSTQTVKWADVTVTDKGVFALTPVAEIDGFPKLDPAKQKLVQMKEAKGRVLVGVRDTDEGKFGSGWVMVHAGSKYSEHGDHGHWSFKKKPGVLATKLDAGQGNPAHVYVYDDRFYVANDLKNGYTHLDPETFSRTAGGEPIVGTPRFIPGGGGHITLAVHGGKVGYGAWVDGGGPNKGRVDVTPLSSTLPAIAYTFYLPAGVIHGATACAGKVFLAPADGICWVTADVAATNAKPAVKHIPLGTHDDKPLRVGAFATHGHTVLAVTGKEKAAKLVLIDAKIAEPIPTFVPLVSPAGTRPLTPVIVGTKNPLAFVFHDKAPDADATDTLEVIALDPNGDGNYADAKSLKVLTVGKSQVDGHFGHHDAAADSDGRTLYFTNPGDGTISVLDVKRLAVVATFPVGGKPTSLVVHGGRETDD